MRKQFLSLLLAAGLAFPLVAQEGYRPSPQILEARKEFQDNKFGIFIHWGIYSMLADGEWVLNNKNINYEEYGKMAGGFYPASFDAREWVKAIKAAGAKYICFTTRHHDGFSMFDSQYSDFTITKATPFKRDIVKELADACHEEGINLHFYYSLIDWTRDDYVPLGNSGRGTGRPLQGQWKDYYAFMNNQLHELLTNYGEVNAIWFDGKWDQRDNPDFDWGFPGIYSRIHEAQPGCLIGNNHHEAPIAGEDIQIFERDLPGQNTAGFSEGQEVSLDLPLETCETMNGMWGYKITDQNYKSTKEEHRPATRRAPAADRPRAPERDGRMDEPVWRNDLWHTRRTCQPTRLGRHDPKGEPSFRPHPQPEGQGPLPPDRGKKDQAGDSL